MLNLLPHQKRKIIRNEYKSRLAIMIMIFAIITLAILSIFLLPTFLLAHIRYEQANEDAAMLSQKIQEEKGSETNLTDTQQEMLRLLQQDPKNVHSPTSLVDAVIASKGANVVLSSFSIRSQDANQGVFIQGVAKTREDLIAFRKTLENDSLWSKVELPIASLGPAKDNAFSMILTVNQK